MEGIMEGLKFYSNLSGMRGRREEGRRNEYEGERIEREF